MKLLKRYALPAAAVLLAGGLITILVFHLDTRRRLDDLEEAVTPIAVSFAALQGVAGPVVDDVAAGLAEFRTSTLSFEVTVDETLPVDVEIPFRRTLQIPIEEVISIDEEFETTVTIQGPFGVDIPLDVRIPVQIDVPLSLTVPIEIDETVPIQAEVPIRLDVPVEVSIAGTELADLIERLEEAVRSASQFLGGSS